MVIASLIFFAECFVLQCAPPGRAGMVGLFVVFIIFFDKRLGVEMNDDMCDRHNEISAVAVLFVLEGREKERAHERKGTERNLCLFFIIVCFKTKEF